MWPLCTSVCFYTVVRELIIVSESKVGVGPRAYTPRAYPHVMFKPRRLSPFLAESSSPTHNYIMRVRLQDRVNGEGLGSEARKAKGTGYTSRPQASPLTCAFTRRDRCAWGQLKTGNAWSETSCGVYRRRVDPGGGSSKFKVHYGTAP